MMTYFISVKIRTSMQRQGGLDFQPISIVNWNYVNLSLRGYKKS